MYYQLTSTLFHDIIEVSDKNKQLYVVSVLDEQSLRIKLRRNVSIDTENGYSYSIEVWVGDAKHPKHDYASLTVIFSSKYTYSKLWVYNIISFV